jgi:hypothetical protein
LVARVASSEHAFSANSVVAAPHSDSKNLRRDTPTRRALRSQSERARRRASLTTGDSGNGSNSPFEHDPSFIGISSILHTDAQHQLEVATRQNPYVLIGAGQTAARLGVWIAVMARPWSTLRGDP